MRFIRTYRPAFDLLGKDPVPIIPDVLFGDKIIPTRRMFIHSKVAPDARIRFRESIYPPSGRFAFKAKSSSGRSVGRDFPPDATKPVKRFTVWKPFFTRSISRNSIAARFYRPRTVPRDIFLNRRVAKNNANNDRYNVLGEFPPTFLGLNPLGFFSKSSRGAKGTGPFKTVSPQGHFPVVLTE